MPANILTDWEGLAEQDFMKSLLLGEDYQQKRLTNQESRTRMPYVQPTLEANLQGLRLGNSFQEMENQKARELLKYNRPMAEAILGKSMADMDIAQQNLKQMPGLYNAQVGLYGAQAGQASAAAEASRSGAALNYWRMDNPLTMVNNDMAALMLGGAFPGAGQQGGAQKGSVNNSLMGNQSAPVDQINSMALQSGPPTQETSQLLGQLNEGAQPDMASRVRDYFGLQMPNYSVGESALIGRGYDPSGALEQQTVMKNVEANNALQRKLNADAANTINTNSSIRLDLNNFKKSYDKAIAKGPIGSHFAQLDPNAQEAVSSMASALPHITQTLGQTGHITDALFSLAQEGKLDVKMHPQVVKHLFEKINSGMDRSDHFQNFLAEAQRNGLNGEPALLGWGNFQRDYPLTGNKTVDRKNLQNSKYYASPEGLAAIVEGRHQPRFSPDELPMDKKEFAMLPKELQKEIIMSLGAE